MGPNILAEPGIQMVVRPQAVPVDLDSVLGSPGTNGMVYELLQQVQRRLVGGRTDAGTLSE